MKKFVSLVELLAAFAMVLGSEQASAALISIDLNVNGYPKTYSGSVATDGGLVPLAGQTGAWNPLTLGPGGGNNQTGLTDTPTVSGLLDGDGNGTSVGFELDTGSATYNAYGHTGDPTDDLGEDVAYLRRPATSVAWRFVGLAPSTAYSIRIFGQTDTGNNPANYATFTVAGEAPASATTSARQNYVDFTATSDGSGVISGTFVRISVSSMSGIQIEGAFPGDAIPPKLDSTDPADNATGVPRDSNLVITFNENVQKGTGNIVIKKSSENTWFRQSM